MAKLIAELCQNHNGDINILDEMVAAAAESGADYAKIQSINSGELSFRERFENGLKEGGRTRVIKRPYKNEYERLKKLDLDEETQVNFHNLCKKYNVGPMTTIFTRSKINLVNQMKLKCVKISSFDCASFKLIDDLKKINVDEFIISTGGTFDREIKKTTDLMKKNNLKFSLLHCISIYPTTIEVANLNRINYLKNFTNNVGISDHSNPEIYKYKIIAGSLFLGAKIVEKHFTILPKDKTKDGVVSANPNQLKEISKLCKLNKEDISSYVKENVPEIEEMKGSFTRELSEEELLNRDYYQGRFVSKVSDKEIFNWDDTEI
jgi:N,N'-diacetyllegionaminate synthase